jgi:hypothetical protein
MFSGFTSRWMMRCACASPSASSACTAWKAAVTASKTRPALACLSSIARSVRPESRAITMKSRPSEGSSPASKTCTMRRWSSFASVLASYRNRARNSASPLSPSSSTLIATSRSIRASNAAHTSPMPPWPSSSRTA